MREDSKTKTTYPPPAPAAAPGAAPATACRWPAQGSRRRCSSRRSGRPSPTRISSGASTRRASIIKAVDENASSWFKLLVGFGPTLLLIGAFVLISRRAAAAAGGGLFALGRSRAKRYSEDQPKVTFEDVAGIDEAENELIEIVDFLKNPAKYQRLGGIVPKGVLLIGAPGTGKTLLARAIAGQAGVPFFSLSASEFIEMIVGVGASRVRDLFKKAREAAPAIIFIDELDAIGRTRGSGAQLGGHDEREQTLNQILTEMDGFDSREGVIVLAATNRADVLEGAAEAGTLRSARHGAASGPRRPRRDPRGAHQERPAGAGRLARAHRRRDPGLVGAELRNLVNEAALLAARKDGNTVGAEDFAEALQKITLGPARNILLNPADRERTAYHEAGHALLALLCPGSDPVHRVSIVPRGMALGRPTACPSTIAPATPRTTCGRASPARSAVGRRRSSSTAWRRPEPRTTCSR